MNAENINYEAVLADLEAKKASIESAIMGIKQILGQSTSTGSKAPINSTSIPSDAFFGMSIPEAAKKYLGIMKKPQSAKTIADALEAGGLTHSAKDFVNNVRSILLRVERENSEIIRVNREWGLAEWYPGRKKSKQNQNQNGTAEEEVGVQSNPKI